MTSDSMLTNSAYQLLDFGEGRKLEKFGDVVVDRPSPAAESYRCQLASKDWDNADLYFDTDRVHGADWYGQAELKTKTKSWQVDFGFASFHLSCSPAGQLGIFPEQHDQWNWIRAQNEWLRDQDVLNLFAYTGGSTLAAASAGARVTHVDAARNMVHRARQNAQLSKLEHSPIRWIIDDVRKFVKREIKREKTYRAILLDPPSYGHGTNKESWQIDRDLDELLSMCSKLLHRASAMILLTCHTPGYSPGHLNSLLSYSISNHKSSVSESGEMNLKCRNGRALPSGSFARVLWNRPLQPGAFV